MTGLIKKPSHQDQAVRNENEKKKNKMLRTIVCKVKEEYLGELE